MAVQFANMLVIIESSSVLNIVMNFVGLVVISEFDDYFYNSVRNEPLKDVLEDEEQSEVILKIEHTTSAKAKAVIEEHRIKDVYIAIDFFKDRTFANKLAYLFYKLVRVFYVSVWYYFLPMCALVGSYVFPYII